MIIGIDLDEVLASFVRPLLNYHNNKYGTGLTFEQVKFFSLSKVWGGTREQTDKKIWDFYNTSIFDNINPVEGAIDGIKNLAGKHKLMVITSRPDIIQEKTNTWLTKHFSDNISSVYFAFNFFHGKVKRKTKLEMCHDLNVSILIEDCLENVKEVGESKTNLQALLFDRPWNRKKLPKNTTRVFTWPEIVKHIEKL